MLLGQELTCWPSGLGKWWTTGSALKLGRGLIVFREAMRESRSLGGGLNELRIHWGPGYRLYYAMLGRNCIVLLCAGDKRKQASDIHRARQYLRDHMERIQTNEWQSERRH
jgi:hypothetical protein